MPKVLRPIGHEDRLSIVDHLDELRSRLIICGAALVVAFGLCFWQNHVILNLLNKPYADQAARTAANHLGGLTNDSVSAAHHFAQRRQPAPGARPVNDPGADRRGPDRRRRPAAQRRRQGAAADDTEEHPDHDRRRRAVHHDADGVLLLLAAADAAGAALRGVRVRDPGAERRRAPGRRAGGDRRAGAVHRRGGVHLSRSSCRRRSASSRATTAASSTISCRPSPCTRSRC